MADGLLSRLLDGCVGCGHEPAAVAVGLDPVSPDETYGARCWADESRWDAVRPAHTHLTDTSTEVCCGQ